jgi:TonB family protein
MKKRLLTSMIFFSFFIRAYSQNDTIFYYDQNWQKTAKWNAQFYRIIENYKTKQKFYKITDYYISGKKQMEGFLEDLDKEKKTGMFTWYFKNGQKSSQVNYKKNRFDGLKEEWYPNGKPMLTSHCNRHGCLIDQAWDSTGLQIAENGNGLSYEIYENGKIKQQCEIKAGVRDGKCLGYYYDGKLYYEENYHDGKLLQGTSYDSTGQKHEYKIVEQFASFQGGNINDFRIYIENHVNYPKNLEESETTDKVIFQFSVMPNGEVSKIKVLKASKYKEFNQQAFLAIYNSPRWAPGSIRGVPSEQEFILPFVFTLQLLVMR